MKKLILFIILLIPTITFSQKDSLDITETERIIDKYSEKISQSFEQGLEKVTPVAERGFEIAVRLQIARGLSYLLVPIFTVIFLIIFYKNYKIAREYSDYSWTEGKGGTIGVISLIIGSCGLISSIPAIYYGISLLIAPEWFAIKEIIEMF